MTLALTAGANTALPTAQTFTVALRAAAGHADLIALLLDSDGRADGDNGVVLFSQPVSAGGAVTLDQGVDTVRVSLEALPAAVERVLVVAQADGTADVTPCGSLTATVSADGSPVAEAVFSSLPAVATLQLVELYLRGGQWKVRALGDGYVDGLAKLLTVHGVEVTDAPAETPTPLNLKKAQGKLNLRKGDTAVVMTKTERITATVSWKSGTDYDVFALVLMRDGTTVAVAAFDAEGVPARLEHAGIRHLGDVKAEATDTFSERNSASSSRSGGGGLLGRLGGGASEPDVQETLEIRLTPEVLAVVPVAYSAISNGGGSFKHYKVSMLIDNGAGTKITIPSTDASDNPGVYTCVPGLIRNTASGVVIQPLEQYSKSGSERRPTVSLEGGEVVVTMDAGPENLPKDEY